uniref:Uncharacterized protein n=1 Tax=Glossina palpalis gambiensis TaxID=67801 RepID=A0A1B0C6D9_9MUSC
FLCSCILVDFLIFFSSLFFTGCFFEFFFFAAFFARRLTALYLCCNGLELGHPRAAVTIYLLDCARCMLVSLHRSYAAYRCWNRKGCWVTVPCLSSEASGLAVAALAALSPVAKGVVLAVRTAVVLSSVFVWPCLDELVAIVSGVGEILGTADARVPLAAAGAVGVLFLLPNFKELPATVNTAPVFARKSIPRVRWSTLLLTTNSTRLKDISPIFASTVMLRLLSCDAPSTIRMVESQSLLCGDEPDEIFANDASGSPGVHDACCH